MVRQRNVFGEFLVEMETSAQEKENLRHIIRRLIQGDKQFFDQHEIVVKDAGAYWVLNYGISKHNEFNRLLRGLVVQKPGSGFQGDELSLIKSFPFIRFFNKHEEPADNVDLSNAEMLEKLDGTMVGVFFPDGNPKDPHWHTRKMLSAHEPDMNVKITGFHGGQSYDFLPLIGQYVRTIPFGPEDVTMTYIFEFIHDASFVVTRYTSRS